MQENPGLAGARIGEGDDPTVRRAADPPVRAGVTSLGHEHTPRRMPVLDLAGARIGNRLGYRDDDALHHVPVADAAFDDALPMLWRHFAAKHRVPATPTD